MKQYRNRIYAFQWTMFMLAFFCFMVPTMVIVKCIQTGAECHIGVTDFIMFYLLFFMWLLSVLAGGVMKANWQNYNE